MDKGNNTLTDGEKLRYWLDFSVCRGNFNDVVSRLVSACMVSPTTFNNWRYGKCRIPAAAKRDMNKVAVEVSGKEIFTVVQPEAYSEGVSGVASGETI